MYTAPGVPFITAGIMTGTAVLTSTPLRIPNVLYFSVQCKWTGTPTGVLKVQVNNDLATPTSATSWYDLVDTVTVVLSGSQPAGSASDCMFTSIQTVGAPWEWMRFVYTNASGTGVLTATGCTKGA